MSDGIDASEMESLLDSLPDLAVKASQRVENDETQINSKYWKFKLAHGEVWCWLKRFGATIQSDSMKVKAVENWERESRPVLLELEKLVDEWRNHPLRRNTTVDQHPRWNSAVDDYWKAVSLARNLLDTAGAPQQQAAPSASGAGQTRGRFKVREIEVLFDDRPLDIGTGAALEGFKALWGRWGEVVPFRELDPGSADKEASEKLRKAISRIKTSLKSADAPVTVENRKSTGYVMREADQADTSGG